MPKKPIMSHYPGMTLKTEEFYKPEDLICGQTIIVYGKECFLYDCDEFTKEWYKKNIGIQ